MIDEFSSALKLAVLNGLNSNGGSPEHLGQPSNWAIRAYRVHAPTWTLSVADRFRQGQAIIEWIQSVKSVTPKHSFAQIGRVGDRNRVAQRNESAETS